MPSIAREQENTVDILNWFTTVNGVLTDMHTVEFRIFDLTGGMPGVQIFPSTPGDYEDVTNAPGRFSVGAYYAYDDAQAQGWTPSAVANLGAWRTNWRWKLNAGSEWQSDSEDFTMLVASGGSSADTYITIADVRAAGILETDYDDAMVLAAIEMWQAFLNRACRQWFIPRAMTLLVDGTDSDALHFGVPIITIDHVKLNGDTVALDSSYYRVYNGCNYPDDRRNPRIKLVANDGNFDIYTQPMCGRLKFRKGRHNQEIKGIFGFVEEDGSVPAMIKRALLLLVIEKLTSPLMGATPAGVVVPPLVGALLEEKTDGHSKKWAQAGGEVSPRQPGLLGITNNPEVLGIIRLYRAPIGVATPANWSYN